MTILVTGGTGKIGRQVAEYLLLEGIHVRTLTRGAGEALPAGVQAVAGDLTTPAAVAAAVDGVDSIFLYPVLEALPDVLEQARRADVRRIVLFTGAWAAGHSLRDRESWTYPRYRAAEQLLADSGVPEWTVLRPAPFASNLLWWSHAIRAGGVVRAPYGAGGSPLIHEADIAAAGVVTLLRSSHEHAAYTLTGPAFSSQVEQVAAIGRAIGRQLRFEELTAEQWRASVSAFVREGIVNDMLREWSETAADPTTALPVSTSVEELTGKPARSVAEWAIDHAADFR